MFMHVMGGFARGTCTVHVQYSSGEVASKGTTVALGYGDLQSNRMCTRCAAGESYWTGSGGGR
jgi:hypothetical protein